MEIGMWCSRQETVHSLALGALLPGTGQLVGFASARWLVLETMLAPVKPLQAATHVHRRVRGQVMTAQGWRSLSSLSGAYTPEFSAMLARCIMHALADV